MENKRKICFRADAGAEIGYGHFIRTLALADMLKDDFECVFYTQSPTEYQRTEAEKVCKLVALPADDSRFQLFLDCLKGDEIVVLDNYFYTTDYQRAIKAKGCKLVCIDDMHDKHYVADAVVNHGFVAEADFSKEEYTQLYIGPDYALLRSPFLREDNSIRRYDNRWVVCFGGSDQNDYTGEAVRQLKKKCDSPEIVAVVGDGYMHTKRLKDAGVIVKQRLSANEMAGLFRSAANVVCSASSVCYESLACECKVFAGYYVENQKDFYENLKKRGYIIPLGKLYQGIWDVLTEEDNQVIKGLKVVQMRQNFRALFYGLIMRQLNYTELTESESRNVWEVRNRPEIRMFMTNPEPFSYESHLAFVKKLAIDPNKLFLAYFDGETLIGTINFVEIGIDSSAERGLFVNPACQGHGMAHVLEKLSEREAYKRGVRYLVAKVKKDNLSSLAFHKKAGYELINTDNEYSYFKRDIYCYDKH